MPKENANEKAKIKDKETRKEGFRFSPLDFLKGKCHIELDGNTTAILEGSKGVLEYSTECIRVSVESFIVSFEGKNLTLKCISPTSLTIHGSILNIGFSD